MTEAIEIKPKLEEAEQECMYQRAALGAWFYDKKISLEHGKFLPWLRATCEGLNMSFRTAQKFIRLVKPKKWARGRKVVPKRRRKQLAIKASENMRRFTDKTLALLRQRRAQGATYTQLMQEFDISSKGTLNYALNRKYVTAKAA
jgi:hypothetical protein